VRNQALKLYKIALQDIGWRPEDVQNHHRWDKEEIETAIRYLSSVKLFAATDSTPSGLLPLSPHDAMARLHEETVRHLTAVLDGMRSTTEATINVLTDFQDVFMNFQDVHMVERSEVSARVIRGGARAAAVAKAMQAARYEVVSLCHLETLTHGWVNWIKACRFALQRKVPVRAVCYAPTARVTTELLQEVEDIEVEVRISTVPLSFTLVDRSLALMPLSNEEECRDCLLVVQSRVLGAVLQNLFTHYWERAFSVPNAVRGRTSGSHQAQAPEGTAKGSGGVASISRHRYQLLLRLLAAGLTDEAIGRRMGVHERTVRRRVSELASALSAESRFQAGVNAVRAGWLDDDADQ
jgi:hypothetical protein